MKMFGVTHDILALWKCVYNISIRHWHYSYRCFIKFKTNCIICYTNKGVTLQIPYVCCYFNHT